MTPQAKDETVRERMWDAIHDYVTAHSTRSATPTDAANARDAIESAMDALLREPDFEAIGTAVAEAMRDAVEDHGATFDVDRCLGAVRTCGRRIGRILRDGPAAQPTPETLTEAQYIASDMHRANMRRAGFTEVSPGVWETAAAQPGSVEREEIREVEERLRRRGAAREAALASLLARVREFVGAHARNGSKTGRDDYTKMLPLKVFEPLRIALDEFDRVGAPASTVCVCGHEKRRHDPDDGNCEAHRDDGQLGVCPCMQFRAALQPPAAQQEDAGIPREGASYE